MECASDIARMVLNLSAKEIHNLAKKLKPAVFGSFDYSLIVTLCSAKYSFTSLMAYLP